MSCLGQGLDTVLSEIGIQQCEAVGRYLRDTKFSNIFVSDLQRTIQVRRYIIYYNLKVRFYTTTTSDQSKVK